MSGVGGQHLKQIGLKSIFPMNKISVMGLVEIIPKIPDLLSLIKYTLAKIDEYNGALRFLLSDESKYMTGSQLIIDGGRTSW